MHTMAAQRGTRDDRIKIMLIDDHPLLRQALKEALEGEPGLMVVADAGSGTEALDLIHSTTPDVALVDLRLPDIDGLDLCERIVAGSSARCIVLTSTPSSKELTQRARDVGAAALVFKGSDLSGLITCVREVATGHKQL